MTLCTASRAQRAGAWHGGNLGIGAKNERSVKRPDIVDFNLRVFCLTGAEKKVSLSFLRLYPFYI